ncbi:hypothetical protein L6452_35529 [Arctium lappa]|uniref:Uncharacterized protein n=1 Tax=Arctium lappa TaxID=4217 RepID=A0ACB8YAV9_ARCLA|nr:hypothetical protein L6452_35529 [Arctium lappa]
MSTASSISFSATPPSFFQRSNFYARQPNPNQKNIFTAQGRDDLNQNTGISILECKITVGSELIANQSMFKSYLGDRGKDLDRRVTWPRYRAVTSFTEEILFTVENFIQRREWMND